MTRFDIRHYATVLLTLLLATSCVEEYNADLPENSDNLLVVEGSIISDTISTFHLTTTIPLKDYNANYYVTGAQVSVHGSDGQVWQGEYVNTDRYQVPVGHLQADEQYWLEVTLANGTQYSSTPAQPLDAPETILSLYIDNDDPNPYVEMRLEVPDSREDQRLCLNYRDEWEILTPLTSKYVAEKVFKNGKWEFIPMTHGFGSGRNKQSIYVHTTDYTDCHLRDYPLYRLPVTSPHLSLLYYTQITCEAVSEEEYRYQEARRKQSDEMGGLFTPQPGNLPSNFRCTSNSRLGAMGFVGVRGNVCRINRWIESDEVGFYEARKIEMKVVDIGSPQDQLMGNNDNWRLFLTDAMANKNTWVSRWAVDYTTPSWGGKTRIAPDYWPTR